MSKKEKRIKQTVSVSAAVPARRYDPDSYMNERPVWRFEKAEISGSEWILDKINDCDFIIMKLVNFERMTWREICQQTHDMGKSSNHFLSISSMTKDAQQLIEERQYQEYEGSFFPLRLDNKRRLIGILTDDIFYILWYDQNHEVAISNKKHT